ncbi:MAG: hypothetical protein HY071_06425 [Chloroflexi bacterium]|nr:hypothetical protein [Chloroflexota bacterium]
MAVVLAQVLLAPKVVAVTGEAIFAAVAEFGIGSGPGQVTYETRVVSDIARGPQSFTVGSDGSVYVLDSLQRRIHIAKAGAVTRTVAVPQSAYLREIHVTIDGTIWLLDNNDRILSLGSDGRPLSSSQLPKGMRAYDVLRITPDSAGPALWTRGYRQFSLGALPATVDLAETLNDKAGTFGGGIAAADGVRWSAHTEGHTIVVGAASGGSRIVVTPQTFGATAQPIGFDASGLFYISVQDAYTSGGFIRVEETIQRYKRSGERDGVARLPTESFVISPHRTAEITSDGQVYVMVPAADKLTVYRVDLGTTYRSSVARSSAAGLSQREDTARAQSIGFPLRSRRLVALRASEMNTFLWPWHLSYNFYSSGLPRPLGTAPNQTQLASDGQFIVGIPYNWGGFDSTHFSDGGWSHSDWATWQAFDGADGALNRYYPQPGPVVGNTQTDVLIGSAGIDCSGYVYAAAGYTSAEGPKKSTVHLRAAPGDPYAGWDAGAYDNVQPMNYFVANNDSHVFYYEYRYIDGSGISTLEAVAENGAPIQGAQQRSRSLRDLVVGQWQHRSWWTYDPGQTYAIPYTAPTYGCFALMGVRGEMVWYRFSTAGTTVRLTEITGGDPDLFVVADNGGVPGTVLLGSSWHVGQQDESVSLPAGNYFAYVHIYATSGGCVTWRITW